MKYRQIVQLQDVPRQICFVEPNYSLVAFERNSIQLIDMSSKYSVEPTVFLGHECAIADMRVFLGHYFVSLDVSGTLKVWSLKGTEIQRRRVSQSRSEYGARQNILMGRGQNAGQLLQSIELTGAKILSFVLNEPNDASKLHMFLATDTGDIKYYHWNNERLLFEFWPSYSFEPNTLNACKLILIPFANATVMMVITRSGTSEFFNLRDHSKMARTARLEFPTVPPINVHAQSQRVKNAATISETHLLTVIFYDRIIEIDISVIGQILMTDVREIYRMTKEQNFINCSMMTDDGKYLTLGTRKGIVVFDPLKRQEVLRSSISDYITCIDVCSLDHNSDFRYTLTSATRDSGSVMHLYGVRTIEDILYWSKNRASPLHVGDRNSSEAWFVGGRAFDVHPARDDREQLIMVAADCRSNVHCINSTDTFQTASANRQAPSPITHVSIGAEKKFYGCENGHVYEFASEEKVLRLEGPVQYLMYFDEHSVLIAGSVAHRRYLTPKGSCGADGGPIVDTFLHNHEFIIVINKDLSFDVSESTVFHSQLSHVHSLLLR